MNDGKSFILRFLLEFNNFLLSWHQAEPHTPVLSFLVLTCLCWTVGFITLTVQMLDLEVKKKTMKGNMNKTYKIVKPHAWNNTNFSRNLFPLPFRQRQFLGLWLLTLQRNSSCDCVHKAGNSRGYCLSKGRS